MPSLFRDRLTEHAVLSAEEIQQRLAGGGSTILVVDDIGANARLLQRLLMRDGHRVLFAQDGEEGGYPDQLRGGAVPLLTQILSVVDVFDALTTVRPYKAALSTERA